MSTLTQFLGSGVRSINTAHIYKQYTGTSTGEDLWYYDASISVTDTAKCVVILLGMTATQAGSAGGAVSQNTTARVTSTTNLRISETDNDISTAGTGRGFTGRYYVVEFW